MISRLRSALPSALTATSSPASRALARALAQSVWSGAWVWLVWAALSGWLGAPDVLSVGIGVVTALAPGAYDYLGRDLLGRRLVEDDPLSSADPVFKFREGKYTRARDEVLNGSDFAFAARLLGGAHRPLAPMVAELDREQWRHLDPEHDLAAAVMTAVGDEIERTPSWARGARLPLYTMFLGELHDRLAGELGLEHVHEEERERRRAPAVRSIQH